MRCYYSISLLSSVVFSKVLYRVHTLTYPFVQSISVPHNMTRLPISFLTALAATIVSSLAAPTKTFEQRAVTSQCAQWASIETGTYILYNNLWGESAGTGSQCSQVNALSGTTMAWSSTWSWSGGPSNVKSYANVVVDSTSRPLGKLKSISTTWAWR